MSTRSESSWGTPWGEWTDTWTKMTLPVTTTGATVLSPTGEILTRSDPNEDAARKWLDSLPEVEPRKDFADYALVAIGAALLAWHAGDAKLMISCAEDAAAHLIAGRPDAYGSGPWNYGDVRTERLLRRAAKKVLDVDWSVEDPFTDAVAILRLVCQRHG